MLYIWYWSRGRRTRSGAPKRPFVPVGRSAGRLLPVRHWERGRQKGGFASPARSPQIHFVGRYTCLTQTFLELRHTVRLRRRILRRPHERVATTRSLSLRLFATSPDRTRSTRTRCVRRVGCRVAAALQVSGSGASREARIAIAYYENRLRLPRTGA